MSYWPDINDDKEWSEMDIADLRNHIAHGCSLQETAQFLCRSGTELDVAAKAKALGLKWQSGGHRRKLKAAEASELRKAIWGDETDDGDRHE
jgi:hypothetical protein